MTEKRCSKCGSIKPLSEYHINKQNLDGHAGVCKTCRNTAARARTLRKRSNTQRTPTGHAAGRQASMLTVECLRDPTRMYGGLFDRESFAGTLYDGYWPDGSVWLLSYPRTAKRTRWRLRGRALYEIGGRRVVKALGGPYAPALKIVDAAQAADD